MSRLDDLSKDRRKELVTAGVQLFKSGVAPTEPPPPRRLTRAEMRQIERARGFRGSKAKPKPARAARMATHFEMMALADDVLVAAEERTLHPIRSRLRRG